MTDETTVRPEDVDAGLLANGIELMLYHRWSEVVTFCNRVYLEGGKSVVVRLHDGREFSVDVRQTYPVRSIQPREPICDHDRAGIVCSGDPGGAHASTEVCGLDACVEDALEWAEGITNLPAEYRPDQVVPPGDPELGRILREEERLERAARLRGTDAPAEHHPWSKPEGEWRRTNREFADQVAFYADRATLAEIGKYYLLPAELAVYGKHELPHPGNAVTAADQLAARETAGLVLEAVLAYCAEVGVNVEALLRGVEENHRDYLGG